MIHGVHARHDRQQHLRRADVAGGLLAADVLFARLQGHAQRRLAFGVARQSDDATGQQTLELIARGKERRMRSAVAHRHTKALRVTNNDIGAPLSRRGQQAQRQQIARHRDQRASGVRRFAHSAIIDHGAIGARILQQRAEHRVVERERARIAHLHHDPARRCTRFDHRDRLRMTVVADQEHITRGAATRAEAQRHRFRGGRAYVEQRRIGDLQAREIDHHRLIIQQRFESSLRDLGLVRRVRRVPRRVLHDVAQNHVRGMRAVIPHADKRPVHGIARRDGLERGEYVRLAARRTGVERATKTNAFRHHRVDEGIQGVIAERGEHRLLFVAARADMARNKRIDRDWRGRDGTRTHDHPQTGQARGSVVKSVGRPRRGSPVTP